MMDPLAIKKEVVIEAPVERVWLFVGVQDGLQRWWHPHELLLEERVGGRYEERGVTASGQPFRLVGMVTVYEPPRRMEMTCRGDFGGDRGTPWPADTRVAIILADLGGRTRVSVVHDGFENLPEAYRGSAKQGFEAGWERTAGNLARLAVPQQAAVTQRIGAARGEVFRALLEPAALAGWFCDTAEVEPRVGGAYAFGGPHAYGGPDLARGRITTLDPGRALGYVWPLAGTETAVAMTLRDVSARETDLEVTHTGVLDLPVPWISPEHLTVTWQVLLRQLDAYVTRRDLPHYDFSSVPPPVVKQEILIAAPPARVWEMLTTPSHLDRWIARQAYIELRVGGRYSYGWGEDGPHGSGPLRILALEPSRLLRVSWREVGGIGTVSWTIAEAGAGRTRLQLVHQGLGRVPGVLQDYHIGWWEFLTGLRWMLETEKAG